jgi:hypothetical protein
MNNIDFRRMSKDTAQCLLDAHQDKTVSMRLRRLQPLSTETIEFHVQRKSVFHEKKLGFTITGGIEKTSLFNDDPGLFIVAINPKGQAARHGRLRVGDRLLQLSNQYSSVNLQCMQLDTALKLINRMINESTSMKLLVAHRT